MQTRPYLAHAHVYIRLLCLCTYSAYDTGLRALGAISKAHDGRGARTALTTAMTSHLRIQRPEDLVRWAYAEAPSAADLRTRIASLAPVVVGCASTGDAVADTILRHGVGELYRSVAAVAASLGLNAPAAASPASGGARQRQLPQRRAFPLVLAGSMLAQGSLLAQYLIETIRVRR